MTHACTWLVALGQLALGIGLLACYFVAPKLTITAEHGISNYGASSSAIFPYSLAFLIAGICTVLAGYVAMGTSARFASMLYVLGALYIAVLLSTYAYQHSQNLRNLHIAVGGALYGMQLILSVWFAVRTPKPLPAAILLTIQLAGTLLSLVSLFNIVRLLLIGQVITGASFSVLLVYMTQCTCRQPG